MVEDLTLVEKIDVRERKTIHNRGPDLDPNVASSKYGHMLSRGIGYSKLTFEPYPKQVYDELNTLFKSNGDKLNVGYLLLNKVLEVGIFLNRYDVTLAYLDYWLNNPNQMFNTIEAMLPNSGDRYDIVIIQLNGYISKSSVKALGAILMDNNIRVIYAD